MKKLNARRLISIAAVVALILAMAAFPAAAKTQPSNSVTWTTHAGQESKIQAVSGSDFTVSENAGSQTVYFSHDGVQTNNNFSDQKISFNVRFSGTDGNNQWGAIFSARMADAAYAPWDVAAVAVEFHRDMAVLSVKNSTDPADHNQVIYNAHLFDGKVHSVSLEINDAAKTLKLTVDEQSVSDTFEGIPAKGGYQWMTMNANAHVENFTNYGVAFETAPAQKELESAIVWGVNPGHDVTVQSSSDLILNEAAGGQIFAYSASAEGVKTDYADDDVAFNFKVENSDSNQDFATIVSTRMKNPGGGPWDPSNESVSVFIRRNSVTIGHYNAGNVTETATIPGAYYDGAVHSVYMLFNGNDVTLAVDGNALTAHMTNIPAEGGYQIINMNAKTTVTGFGHQVPAVPDQTEPETTQPETTQPETTQPETTQPQGTWSSNVKWMNHPGQNVVVNSPSDLVIDETAGMQVPAFSFGETDVRTDYADNRVRFNIKIENTQKNTDWATIFSMRNALPAGGPWEPANSNICVIFRNNGATLSRYAGGVLDEAHQVTIPGDLYDSQNHQVSIEISGKDVTLTVDGQSATAHFNIVPKIGGYQFINMNAKSTITGFANTYTVNPQTGDSTIFSAVASLIFTGSAAVVLVKKKFF